MRFWLALSVCLVVSSAVAAYGGEPGSDEPFEIWTAEQMNAIGAHAEHWSLSFVLMADIDLSILTGSQYRIIGNKTTPFTGRFDGNGHVIRNLSYTTTANLEHVGLFGYTSGAEIVNLALENIHFDVKATDAGSLMGNQQGGAISACSVLGSSVKVATDSGCCAGGLVGYSKGEVNSCTASVSVETFSSSSSAGGLVGQQSSGTIDHCSSSGSITSRIFSSGFRNSCGGLVGGCGGTIYNSSSSCSVKVQGSRLTSAGGLAGNLTGGLIDACFSTGAINYGDAGTKYIGGLVGEVVGTIQRCWSSSTSHFSRDYALPSGDCYAGGLAGTCRGTIRHCYCTGSVLAMTTDDEDDCYAGGLVGHQYLGMVSNCYSISHAAAFHVGPRIVGGVAARADGVVNCSWDTDASELDYSCGGHGRPTSEMMRASTFVGWNSPGDINWVLDEGSDYPRLAWENTPGRPLPAQGIGDLFAGSGTVEDPYRINTAAQLNAIGLFPDAWDKVFRLDSDIDMRTYKGDEYNIVGLFEWPFTGVFDGNGFTIHNLTYSTPYAMCAGLFGRTVDAVLQNLNLAGFDMRAGGSLYCGALTGIQDGGTISHCVVHGAIAVDRTSPLAGGISAGGLVGSCRGTIRQSSSGGRITVEALTNCTVGGLAGQCIGAVMSDCSSVCSVNTSVDKLTPASSSGGLVGMQCFGSISNCCSRGSVTTEGTVRVGGLVGDLVGGTGADQRAAIEYSYSTGKVLARVDTIVVGGGLLGSMSSLGCSVLHCFWDTQASGLSASHGGSGAMGRTTVEMTAISNYTDAAWDFDTTWCMRCPGLSYPRLQWQAPAAGDLSCPEGVGFEDLTSLAASWLSNGGPCDLNGDEIVDLADLGLFAPAWRQK